MKKIIVLTIICLSVYITGFSQQLTTIKDIVTVNLPSNTERLTKEKLADLKPKGGKVSPMDHDHFNGESFRGKSFLVQLNASTIASIPGYLEQRKREMDNLFSLAQPPVYSSTIKRFQNHSAVVTNYEYPEDTKGYFLIKSYNNKGDNVLIVTLEYDKNDKKNAEQALDEMLISIKFKK